MSEKINITDNLEIYNRVREVPPEATRPIDGGRLKGKTDINPMWRIKILTEQFGPAGVGWKYEVLKMWTEQSDENTIAAFANINLYVKYLDEWSEPIFGTGGSIFKEIQKGSPYTNDECYKMALTDALSVACKALGVAADIYWDKDKTKYDVTETDENLLKYEENVIETPIKELSAKQINRLHAIRKSANVDEDTLKKILIKHYNKSSSEELTRPEYDFICTQLEAIRNQHKNPA